MAHHPGRLHHPVLRQLERDPDEEDTFTKVKDRNGDGVKTVVSVVIKTMPKTFEGDAVWVTQPPKTLIDPAVREPTTTRPPGPAKQTPKGETDDAIETSSRKTASTLMVATSSPTLAGTLLAATNTALLPSSTSTGAAQAAESTSASSGMSGGAKAGLALGILVAIGALLVGVLFLYRRKKNKVAEQKSIDDEKSAMQNAFPPPIVEPAPSIRTQRTMSTAPRLSLRPVTQFSPTFAENRKSGGNPLPVAAAAVPASHAQDQALSPQQQGSPWERPGAANAAATPQNPFNDPVSRSNTPPQNPFESSPISDVPQESHPSTPSAAPQPDAPAGPPPDFPDPAPAIVAATAAAAAPAVAMAATGHRNDLPAPPPVNGGMVPPSPAWTDDIPASPGPAPTGPPPIAVAGGSAHGPAPAPPNNVHRVQLDFKPSMHDELELRAGQLVRMLHEYDDGWALCIRMDRSQQGVVPRTCLSKHPVKPRTGPPRQGPPGPRARGPPLGSPMGPGGVPGPLTPSSRPSSPHPPSLSPANGRMSPAPRSMSPGPRNMPPGPRSTSPGPRNMPPGPPRSMSPGPRNMPPNMVAGRARSNSTAPYAGPPRSMSPGPYGGGPQHHMPPPQMGRPRSNSASQVMARRASPPGPSPMNPNVNLSSIPARKPVPGQAL
ncbi:uncharacterized protein EI97DRAFT_438015 [Westerdykella ornata]|uniref:SH3 domain-containing protein n=1 Tax=Westerdykella ornata TaxID=318751 RepID=A0A6A6J5K1_WESOR|nr:uncharacterized protein EI97DRAFT_438015 [Westerdykella ornata]KAF2271248.1 hypothetical protein EI97DRAFT_438015 [Westerdykella ornata]